MKEDVKEIDDGVEGDSFKNRLSFQIYLDVYTFMDYILPQSDDEVVSH